MSQYIKDEALYAGRKITVALRSVNGKQPDVAIIQIL